MNNTTDFVCPACYDRSCFKTTCIRCSLPMVPEGATTLQVHPAVGKQRPMASSPEWKVFESPVVAAISGALMMIAVAAAIVSRVAIRLGEGWWAWAPLVVALVISWLHRLEVFSRVSAWVALRAAAQRYPSGEPTRIAQASDGLVRIVGKGSLLFPHITPDGRMALAYRTGVSFTAAGGSIPVLVEAGCIAIADGSGVNALVNTGWIEIIGRKFSFDGSVVIPPGATVEVTGYARRVPVAEAANGGLRHAPEVLEFEGSEEHPVVIRVVDDAALVRDVEKAMPAQAGGRESNAVSRETSGIRVVVESTIAQRAAEVASASSSSSTHRSVRS